MNEVSESYNNRILPPWLWFWLGVYLLYLPDQISLIQIRLGDLFSLRAMPGEKLISLSFLFRLMEIMEIVPLLAVLLGVLTIFAPWFRADLLRRWYCLNEPPAVPALIEICGFLSKHAPNIKVKANLRRTDELAFVYPLGYRTFAIALFGGMVILWRKDRQAAKAVLLHEIAHYRQGDALIVGAGSFFEGFLRRWLLLYIGFVVLPLIFNWGYETIRFVRDFIVLQDQGATIPFTKILLHEVSTFFRIYLPKALLLSIGLLFWTFSIVVLPLIGIWCAELNADRFAIEAQQSRDVLIRMMEKTPGRISRWRWLFLWMSHPPHKLRRWMTLWSDGITGLAFLLLLFPLAYIIKLLMLLGWATTGHLMITSEIEDIVRALGSNINVYLEGIAPVWISMAVLLLLWPMISRYWEWLFCRNRGSLSWMGYQGYIVGVILIGALAISGYETNRRIAGVSTNEVATIGAQGQWSKGTLVEVKWQDKWYKAEILEIQGKLFKIHYEGYDISWDEWVDPSRIRSHSQ